MGRVQNYGTNKVGKNPPTHHLAKRYRGIYIINKHQGDIQTSEFHLFKVTSNDIQAFALAHKLINKTSQTKFGFERSFVYKEGCFAKIQLLLKSRKHITKAKGGSARFTNKKLSFSKRSILFV